MRLGSISPQYRGQLESVVRATGVFNEEEIAVALEIFDEATAEMGNGKSEMALPFPISDSPFPPCGYEFVGAFQGDRLVGYACYGPTPATDKTYDLYWIAVHPKAQRSGSGGALMTEVERRLAERRARMLVVETSSRDDYEPTRQFYHKRGYEQAAQVRDFYSRGDHRVVLTKDISEGLSAPRA